MMLIMVAKMNAFTEHHTHVIHYKTQIHELFTTFQHNKIIIKVDFIQNIVHGRGRETSQLYYGKRQTQFLLFVIWYIEVENSTFYKQKIFVDYLSSYLKHNSLYFQKCLIHLLVYLENQHAIEFDKVHKLSLKLHSLTCIIFLLTFLYRFSLIVMVERHISNHTFHSTLHQPYLSH